MPQPLLEANVGGQDRDARLERLTQDNIALRDDLSEARRTINALESDLEAVRSANTRAVQALRRQLMPMYRALQALFGELDAVAPEGIPEAGNPKVAAVWQSWITKLPGKRAEIIKALLEHGEMTVAQLRVATHSGTQTIYENVSKLRALGLIVNTGQGRYSLKSLE